MCLYYCRFSYCSILYLDKDKAVDCGESDSELSSTTAAMTGCMVWVEEIRANTDQTYNKHKPKINMVRIKDSRLINNELLNNSDFLNF